MRTLRLIAAGALVMSAGLLLEVRALWREIHGAGEREYEQAGMLLELRPQLEACRFELDEIYAYNLIRAQAEPSMRVDTPEARALWERAIFEADSATRAAMVRESNRR